MKGADHPAETQTYDGISDTQAAVDLCYTQTDGFGARDFAVSYVEGSGHLKCLYENVATTQDVDCTSDNFG